ncbi:unnamed protein product [Candida verbasci]|uniref:Uncharacterized protein n=1 Tax=Candida verbasci TaxID=1227364 RepID=A0A9W4TSD2_9ASCO|nr:unnamed protein product [Candida verbasci]
MEVKDILIHIGSLVIYIIELLLTNTITFVVGAHNKYPDITSIIFLLISLYLFYKVFIKAVRLWINFIITTIKTLAVLFFLFLVFVIYVRGWEIFKNNDIPLIKQFIQSSLNFNSNKNLWNLFSNLQNLRNLQNFKSKNINQDDSKAYFDYINSRFGGNSNSNSNSNANANGKQHEVPDYSDIENMVSEGIEYLHDKIDLQQFGDNLKDFLNKF